MTQEELSRYLKGDEMPHGVLILAGEERYLIRHYLTLIRKRILQDPSFASFNHMVYEGAEIDFASLFHALGTPPVFAEGKSSTTVTGVEMFHKLLPQAEAGDNIGALLRGIAKDEIERGQVLCKPGSINPHTKFVGQVYVLTEKEGGRSKPFFAGYRPQFYFRTTDVTGVIELPEGVEMCRPGDNVDMTVELISPIAMEKGLRFAIREGGRTVGSGVVAEIIE